MADLKKFKKQQKGFKIIPKNLKSRDFKFETDKVNIFKKGTPRLCTRGLHSSPTLLQCLEYYPLSPLLRGETNAWEIRYWGDCHVGSDKTAATHMKLVRKLSLEEILVNINPDSDPRQGLNLGQGNTGNFNIGNYNEGDFNIGDFNAKTGKYNVGNQNEGCYNVGSNNTGNNNTGGGNKGSYNTGRNNTGSHNTGCRNLGDLNIGDSNKGNYNTGDSNKGNNNTGNENKGSRNTGDQNQGSRNTGDQNRGSYNVGDFNFGGCNTGCGNIGDYNTGHLNTSHYNTGCFNEGKPPINVFDHPVDHDIYCNKILPIVVHMLSSLRSLPQLSAIYKTQAVTVSGLGKLKKLKGYKLDKLVKPINIMMKTAAEADLKDRLPWQVEKIVGEVIYFRRTKEKKKAVVKVK